MAILWIFIYFQGFKSNTRAMIARCKFAECAVGRKDSMWKLKNSLPWLSNEVWSISKLKQGL